MAYFKTGQKGKGLEILDAVTDCYFSSKNPGQTSHVLTGRGASDLGDLDFSDVSSMYLRLVVEGLFGIRRHLLDDIIEVAPSFPLAWEHASISTKDFSLDYHRDGSEESFKFHCMKNARRRFKVPLRSSNVEAVFLNGAPAEFKIEPAVGNCFLIIDTRLAGLVQLRIIHDGGPLPTIKANPTKIPPGSELQIELSDGEIIECRNTSDALSGVTIAGDKVYAKCKDTPGSHTLFVRVKSGLFDAWLPVDFMLEPKRTVKAATTSRKSAAGKFEPIDISGCFNSSIEELHTLEYRSPRPKGYSIGVRLNGRYAWEWNHDGHNAVHVDGGALRGSRGLFRSPSGIDFMTPAKGPNIACVSIWDNFPTSMRIPLSGKARELALFCIGVTNPMQSHVENARLTVAYKDGAKEEVSLVHSLEL